MKKILYIGLTVFISCHPNQRKDTATNANKDTVRQIAHNQDKEKPVVLTVFDTIVYEDTLKVVLYNDTMIRCSLNHLSDSFNASPENVSWDTAYYSYHNIAPILMPNEKSPKEFILNDSLLIIPVCNWRGSMMLFLLNRTKNSLRFAQQDSTNPIYEGAFYVYADMKNNFFIGHGTRWPHDDSAGNPGCTPYVIRRYSILNRHFVRTDLIASQMKELPDSIDPDSYSGAKAFYRAVMRNIKWKQKRP